MSSNAEFFYCEDNVSKTYMFHDNMHLAKHIRNNLLNAEKFVLISFSCDVLNLKITLNDGYTP